MANGKFVAYLRVSTERQGKSGLGLEAQRRAIVDHLKTNGGQLIAPEYQENESGRMNVLGDRRENVNRKLGGVRVVRAHKIHL